LGEEPEGAFGTIPAAPEPSAARLAKTAATAGRLTEPASAAGGLTEPAATGRLAEASTAGRLAEPAAASAETAFAEPAAGLAGRVLRVQHEYAE
jgi:hypothetical protein